MLVSDLDETLIFDGGSLDPSDRAALEALAEQGVLRVIATGRSLASARTAMGSDWPIDYLVFSSGAGLLDWQTQELLHARGFDTEQTEELIALLRTLELDFMVQAPIPDNHRFGFYRTAGENPDFDRRCERYRGQCWPLDGAPFGPSTQLLVVAPPDRVEPVLERVSNALHTVQLIRTTSPLDHRSLWLEVFPVGVTKATGVQHLLERLPSAPTETLAVGNDYNDEDLLRWAQRPFVMERSPSRLLDEFGAGGSRVVASVAQVIERHLASLRRR
jgi:hypothetical protein